MDNLDDFLQEQTTQGQQDSEGVFTISMEKAAWKLAHFQLAERSLFVLHLLACAVANQATVFRATSSLTSKKFSFYFDGPAFSAADLNLLNLPMADGRTPPRIRELAIALSAAAADTDLEFSTVSETSQIRLAFSKGEAKMEELCSPTTEPGHHLHIKKWSGSNPLDTLKSRGLYAPLDIQFNGKSKGKKFDFGDSKQMLFGLYQKHGTNAIPVEQPDDETPSFEATEENQTSFCLALAWPAVAQSRGWSILSNGVHYPLTNPPFQFPFLCGVIDGSRLKKDISLGGFVENEGYQTLMSEVRSGIDDLFHRYYSRPGDISDNFREQMALELSIWYTDRPIPRGVKAFLVNLENHDSNTGILARIAGEALDTNSWGDFKATRKSIRRRFQQCYLAGALSTALSWLDKEEFFLSQGQRDLTQLQQLRYYLYHIHQEPQLHELPPPEDDLAGFRSLLCQLEHLAPKDALALLDKSTPPAHLSRPLEHFLLTISLNDRDGLPQENKTWSFGFKLWQLARTRDFDTLAELLNSKDDLNNLLWRMIILTFFRGQMSQLQYLRWGIHTRFDCWREEHPLLKRCLRLLGRIQRRPYQNHGYLLGPDYKDCMATLVFAQMIPMVQEDLEMNARALLGRALLLESLLEEF